MNNDIEFKVPQSATFWKQKMDKKVASNSEFI
jgi:hypothetical protein